MRRSKDWAAAFAATAAMVGAGFASGRELVVFFAGQGVPSWLGVMVSSAGTGFLAWAVTALAIRTGKQDLPSVFYVVMGRGSGIAAQIVYSALIILCAAAMLSTGATLGALTFPVQGSFLIGLFITLVTALLIAGRGALPIAGLTLVLAMIGWYVALGISQTPPYGYAQGSFLISGASGLIYAALNTTIAASVLCMNAGDGVHPRWVGVYTGVLMAAMLLPANWALMRGGTRLYEMALPSVVMAASWGTTGYYVSIAALFVAVVTTLAAMLSAMQTQMEGFGLRSGYARFFSCAVVLALAMAGPAALINVGYPVAGFISAIMLLILTAYL